MAKTQAAYQKEYRARQKLTRDTNAQETNAPPKPLVCRTCGGPVQHAKVVKCLKCCTGQAAPSPEPTPEPAESGPLSVYSDRRWAYLKDKGYVWVESLHRAYSVSGLVMGVTVPGDPGYKGTESLSKAG